jgi:hypothetical protein
MDVLDHEVREFITSPFETVASVFGTTERHGVPLVEPD